MTNAVKHSWEDKQTPETQKVKNLLEKHFKQVDCYRYNSASIRVRVIDPRFERMPREKRDEMVEQYLTELPKETQQDIMTLLTFAPSEIGETHENVREFLLNTEFEEPSPSML